MFLKQAHYYMMDDDQIQTYQEMKDKAAVQELNPDSDSGFRSKAVKRSRELETQDMLAYADIVEGHLLPNLKTIVEEKLKELSKDIQESSNPNNIHLFDVSFNSIKYEESLGDKLRLMSTWDIYKQRKQRAEDNRFVNMMKSLGYEWVVGVSREANNYHDGIVLKQVKMFRIFTHTDLPWRLAALLGPHISFTMSSRAIDETLSSQPGNYQAYEYTYHFHYHPFGLSERDLLLQQKAYLARENRIQNGLYRTLGEDEHISGKETWKLLTPPETPHQSTQPVPPNAPKHGGIKDIEIDENDPLIKTILKLLDEVE